MIGGYYNSQLKRGCHQSVLNDSSNANYTDTIPCFLAKEISTNYFIKTY